MDIATPREVLETLTAMLRGEKSSEQMKAAEYLAKHYGLLAPKEERAPMKSELAGEIEAAVKAIEAEREQDG